MKRNKGHKVPPHLIEGATVRETLARLDETMKGVVWTEEDREVLDFIAWNSMSDDDLGGDDTDA